ncbi:MAG: hypothetical protein Q8R10_19640 [Pseudomonas sp.]|uniref:hypothetical protein n=1 Tax=Pseudomonas sp. TaxID=306 RepID=UPI002732FABC|nr:hypothetical protein [Pseudomonas sp.]MDP3848638.1 hypothetical protein [Pseudomonas sp.]
MNESTHWPVLCEIDGIDPYPWHGLVYRISGQGYQEYLNPMDGRPVIPLPAPPPIPDTAHSYYPRLNGVLWDLGRPDPPAPPLMAAGSGRSLGRRGVSPGGKMPVRLGEKTYQVEINAYQESTGIRLALVVAGVYGPTFATLSMADFGIDLAGIYAESSGSPLSELGTFELRGFFYDATPDGARRLYAAQLARTGNPTALFDSVPVGFFEVLLGLAPDLTVTATASVVRQVQDCLGTCTNGGSHAYSLHHQQTSASCAVTYVLEPTTAEVTAPYFADAGTATRTQTRTGLVTGAQYVAGEIGYFTCDKSKTETLSGTWAKPGYTGTPYESAPGVWSCDYLGVDTMKPVTTTRQRTVNESLTARFGAHSITGTYTSTANATVVETWHKDENNEQVMETEVSGGVSWTLLGHTASAPVSVTPLWWLYIEPPPGALVMPAPGTLALAGGSATLARQRSFQGIAACFNAAHDGAQSGVLHATGVTGAQATLANIRLADEGRPIYDAALCPITRAAVRACDLSADKIILGWL